MPWLPRSNSVVAARHYQANKQRLRVNELANNSRGLGNGDSRDYAHMPLHVAPFPAMAIPPAIQAFPAQSHGFLPSDGGLMLDRALHSAVATQTRMNHSLPPLTPAALAEALALHHHRRIMSLAMSAPPTLALGHLSWSEQHNLARALALQPNVASHWAAAAVAHVNLTHALIAQRQLLFLQQQQHQAPSGGGEADRRRLLDAWCKHHQSHRELQR